MLFTWWFAIWSMVTSPVPPPHPIHVSVSDVVLTESRIEWTSRIYTDDLLLGIYGEDVTPGQLGDLKTIRADVLRYLASHIRLTDATRPITWSLDRIEPDPEALAITLSADRPAGPADELRLLNSTLTEVYADQKNIVKIHSRSGTQHFLFGKGDRSRSFRD